jgi:hypothetical protein
MKTLKIKYNLKISKNFRLKFEFCETVECSHLHVKWKKKLNSEVESRNVEPAEAVGREVGQRSQNSREKKEDNFYKTAI